MKLLKHKKGQELSYILFLVIFITLFSIIGMIFQVTTEESTNTENWVTGISEFISDIPIIGTLWDFLTATRNFIYVHPYLSIIYLAFFGVPAGYIIIKLIRGGG